MLLHALQDLHPAPRDFQIVALVTPETVDAATIGELRRAGYDLVIGVEPIGSGKAGQVGLELMGKVVSCSVCGLPRKIVHNANGCG